MKIKIEKVIKKKIKKNLQIIKNLSFLKIKIYFKFYYFHILLRLTII